MSDPVMGRDESSRRGFLRRHGAAAVAGVIVIVVVAVASFFLRIGDQEPPRKVQNLQIVNIVPPPPPPPPPPPKEIPQPKMIEQPAIKEPEPQQDKPQERPKEAPPKPVEAPPTGPLGLDAKVDGPGDAFNLVGNPGGNGLLGGGGGGGSRWGGYDSMVQTQIEEAIRDNKKTRSARLRMELRVWADDTGRITRVQLVSSSGDTAIDDAISREVLPGLKLPQPPPKDMPMPIHLRASARRPE
jgi:periplasmic protein TonB